MFQGDSTINSIGLETHKMTGWWSMIILIWKLVFSLF